MWPFELATWCDTLSTMAEYDTGKLATLGRQRRKLNADLAENRREIIPEVIKALRAGVPQVRVVELSGYTREQIRRLDRAHSEG